MSHIHSGIVPENRLARLFRDAVGFANQSIAKNSDRVISSTFLRETKKAIDEKLYLSHTILDDTACR